MKKTVLLIAVSAVLLIMSACGNNDSNKESANDKLQVVASFTIISDMVREIGGEKVEVHNLVPTGTDPHEYDPLPNDIKKATDADVLFYNGLNLEGGESGWFFRMMETVDQKDENIFSLTERVEPMYLTDEESREEEINPHGFIDPTVGIKMAEDMRDAFVKVDPDNQAYYEEQATAYLARLQEIADDYASRLGGLPDENKMLVTSECAFQYMLNTYDMAEACIWKIDTEENGSPAQITSLIDFVQENEVPVLFVESNVDTRPMETVSAESGVKIFEQDIYSDEIGMPGEEVDTYVKYLNYNIEVIVAGLSE